MAFLDAALSTVAVGAVVVVASYGLAYCFPSKGMLDAEAAERQQTEAE